MNPNIHTISFPGRLAMSDDEFFEFCQANRQLDFERDKYGNIIIMSPNSSLNSRRHSILQNSLFQWNEDNQGKGVVFDASAGFTLPDTSVRSPDVAWVVKEKWNKLTNKEKSAFAPIVPEFIMEVMSPSDTLKDLQDKMGHWIENGVQLGWLIDPENEKAYIYTSEGITRIAESFDTQLDGAPMLPGFTFDLSLLRDQ